MSDPRIPDPQPAEDDATGGGTGDPNRERPEGAPAQVDSDAIRRHTEDLE